MRHKFEIFNGGCELCKKAIEILRNVISEDNEIIEYNLHPPIEKQLHEKVMKYDIKAVPSIVVDEKHKIIGIPEPNEIKKIISVD